MGQHPAIARPIAHRGLHNIDKGIAENSATAFELAIERGYGIECDLQLSSDGEAMVIHDDVLDRVAEAKGRVREMTANDIAKIKLSGSSAGDRTLYFAELLALVDGRVPVAVEIKAQHDGRNDELVRFAVTVAATYKGLLAFISFDPNILALLRKHGFKGPTGIIVERLQSEMALKHLTAWQRFAMRNLLHHFQTRFDLIACSHMALTMPSIRLFRALGFPVLTWTIKNEQEEIRARPHCDQIAFEEYSPLS